MDLMQYAITICYRLKASSQGIFSYGKIHTFTHLVSTISPHILALQ